MITKLDKDIKREVDLEGSTVFITLTATKKLILKVRGERDEYSISLEALLAHLNGTTVAETPKTSVSVTHKEKTQESGFVVDIADVRSKILVSGDFDLDTKIKFERLIAPIIHELSNKKKK